MENENENELKNPGQIIREYLRIFFKWLWLLILSAGLVGGFFYHSESRKTPLYRASTLVEFSGSPSAESEKYEISTLKLEAYKKTLTSRIILDPLSELVAFDVTPQMIRIETYPDTQLMKIHVIDSNPTRAAIIANTIVTVFSKKIQNDSDNSFKESLKILEDQLTSIDNKIQEISIDLDEENALVGTIDEDVVRLSRLETEMNYYQQTYYSIFSNLQQIKILQLENRNEIIQLEPALIPGAPFEPKPMQSGMMGALIGFIAAGGIVVIIQILDDSIHDPKEITDRWGIPILGIIPHYSHSNENYLAALEEPRSYISESFRMLRTNLQFASVDQTISTLLVTSCFPKDGKTTVSSNIATILAQSNQPTILIDADLRRPQVHKYFRLGNRKGLSDQFIELNNDVLFTSTNIGVENLSVITSGNLPPNPSELLGSGRMVEILDNLGKNYKYIVIDSAPILSVTDALSLAARVDGVILVVNPRITKQSELLRGLDQLKLIKAHLLGVVINDLYSKRLNSYYYSDNEDGKKTRKEKTKKK